MAVTFDGAALLIILESGVTEVDARDDLYTEWKNWQRANGPGGSSNRQFPPAFRVTAGDPITGTLDSGGYFFIRNDLGWRVRPAEEHATILLTGNLVPEDSTIGVVVPTLGAYTVMILGLQPVTQNVDKIARDVLEKIVDDHAGVVGSLAEALAIVRGARLYHILDGGDGQAAVALDSENLMITGRLRIFGTAAAVAAATMGAADGDDNEIASASFTTTAAVAGKLENMRVG
jgi:hypothetical protein